MRHLLILLPLLLGCESAWWTGRVDYSPAPYQDEAVGLVWGFYGAMGHAPPVVGWMEHSDCIDGDSPGFTDPDNACVSGEYMPTYGLIILARRDRLYASSLAHELGHAASYALTGDADGNHASKYFIPGGLVEQANNLLFNAAY